ncbi:MAG: hypothetical protein CMO55_01395 [Verrucomicrobiales bacterium]|nr:hypothetical protein [Verrucomicrobiales bacterium]
MRFRSLTKWNINEEIHGLLFFAQRSEELLFDYTLDSYKPPAHTPSSLSLESLQVIKEVELGRIDSRNIDHVVEELSDSIKHDKVAKSLLDLPLEKYLNHSPDSDLSGLKARIEILSRTLERYRYFERCEDLLKQAIRNGQKKDIDALTKMYFSTLLHIGVHKDNLYKKTRDFFFTGSEPEIITNLDAFDSYSQLIYPFEHKFRVFFIATDLIADIKQSLKTFKTVIHETLPSDIPESPLATTFIKNADEKFVEVSEITALDCETARESAERRLDRLRDFFTLYHHKSQVSWHPETLILQCCNPDPQIVSLPRNSMEKVSDLPPKAASEKLNYMLKNMRLHRDELSKFGRVVDFHGLAVTNSDPENQLMSLWIALEALVPMKSKRSKITEIIDGVIPFITTNYVNRIFRKTMNDLIRWNRREIARILHDVALDGRASLTKRLFHLTAFKENEDLRNELFNSLRDFELMRFRIFTLSECLSSPKKTKKFIEKHELRVTWQIRRIYRTRNLIVHTGRTPSSISPIIENGHDYLDQVLLTIVRMSTSNYKIQTIPQAFELASIAREKIFRYLESAGENHNSAQTGVLLNEHEFVIPPS